MAPILCRGFVLGSSWLVVEKCGHDLVISWGRLDLAILEYVEYARTAI